MFRKIFKLWAGVVLVLSGRSEAAKVPFAGGFDGKFNTGNVEGERGFKCQQLRMLETLCALQNLLPDIQRKQECAGQIQLARSEMTSDEQKACEQIFADDDEFENYQAQGRRP